MELVVDKDIQLELAFEWAGQKQLEIDLAVERDQPLIDLELENR